MRTYENIRDEWIHLRKIKKIDKIEIDYIKQAVLGLVVDKTDKLAKAAAASYPAPDVFTHINDFTQQAIKSELKQTEDSLKQGVDCQQQVDILKSLLPLPLNESETSGIIIALLAREENPNMGMIMKELKTIQGIDMKVASRLVKELL